MVALITGATSGIGRATAQLFARHGYDLILCGRRAERLDALAAALGQQVRVLTRRFDVADRAAVQQALQGLPAPFDQVDVLINNAGNAHGLAPVQRAEAADWDAMIDSNVRGLLYVTEPVVKAMVARRAGHVINVGSTAAKEVYPQGSVYCATKHAVDALTTGMRMDLYPYGIRVAAVHPGFVETEFSLVRFKGDAGRATGVYAGFAPLQADDVAEVILFMVTRPPHVNLTDVVMMPTAQASATLVARN